MEEVVHDVYPDDPDFDKEKMLLFIFRYRWDESSEINEFLKTVADQVITSKRSNGIVDLVLDCNPVLGH